MKLYIKNMACIRCKTLVKSELEKNGFSLVVIKPGELEISGNIGEEKLNQLRMILQELGLEVIDDQETILMEKINHAITELVYDSEEKPKVNFSEYISSRLGYSYNYLSNLFSAIRGASIEKFFIQCKTDRVKEILIHEDITFTEIAFKMHYSSTAHLSTQFKKETGLTLTQFQQLHRKSNNKTDDQ
jgi:AraC-like DNA-binding protein